MTWRAILAAGAALALALPSGAAAATLHLGGSVVGEPRSRAQITVVKRHGLVVAISKIKFTRVAVTCSDGSSGAINGVDTRTFTVRGKNFTRKTRIEGSGIEHGYFRATGRFSRGGKAVAGNLRFAFKATSGAGCGTGKARWKAQK
jgi:hypothetical protein